MRRVSRTENGRLAWSNSGVFLPTAQTSSMCPWGSGAESLPSRGLLSYKDSESKPKTIQIKK